jgi:hypothetical protein
MEAPQIVDALLDRFLDGEVSAVVRNALTDYLNTSDSGGYEPFQLTPGAIDKKVRGLVHLILASPAYNLA